MNAQTLKYLQKDEIGKVIATGLATLYINKPDKPVQYLAQWLKSYSFNQKQMALLLKAEQSKQESFKQYQKQVQIKTKQQTQKKSQYQKNLKTIDDFKSMVAQSQYFDDLLPEALPQFLQKNTKATGVYIIEYSYPPKDIKQEDTQQLAHLNTSVDKVLNYIGTSISHKSLLRGKQLATSKGVTFKSFQLLQPQGPPVVGQDGQQIAQAPKSKYLFVADVVKNQNMHYFKIPKLGSYLAVPIECNQYLTESNFDVALKQKLEYLKQVEQFQKTKRNEIQQLQKEKVDFEKKIAELIQKNAEKVQIQPLEVELKDVNDAIQEKQEQKVQEKQPTLISEKRSIAVCSDTLGKDIQFSEKQINFIVEIAYHLKDSWQKQHKKILRNDIEIYLEGKQKFGGDAEIVRKNFAEAADLNQEEQKQLAGIAEEQRKNYRQLEIQIGKIKTLLQQNSIYLQNFLNLKKLRVIKYRSLIQNILYFIGLKKGDVNEKNKTTLNWRQARQKLITESTWKKILSYNWAGPKKDQYQEYGKTPNLIEAIEKLDEEEIFKYSISLGSILILIKKYLQVRELDVEIRRQKLEADRKLREKIVQDNQKVNKKMGQDLEKVKAGLTGQALSAFSQTAWKNQFLQKNPIQEVPAEPVEDIDNDM